MPTPITTVGVVQQAQAPNLRAANAHVDLSTFMSGLTSVNRVVAAREASNAGNRGKNTAYKLQLHLEQSLAPFEQQHAHEPDYLEQWTEKTAQLTDEFLSANPLGSSETEQLAFETTHNQFMLQEGRRQIASSHKAFVGQQTKILQENVAADMRGSEQMDIPQLAEAYANLANTINSASLGGPGAGFLPGPIAQILWDQETRKTEVNRLIESALNDPATVLTVLGDGEGSLELPQVDENGQLLVDENGVMITKTVPLSVEERAAVKDAIDKDVQSTNSREQGLKSIRERKYEVRKNDVLMNMMDDLAQGAVDPVRLTMETLNSDGSPMFTPQERANWESWQHTRQQIQGEGVTTSIADYFEAQQLASLGQYGPAQAAVSHTLSRTHRDKLLIQSANVNIRKFDAGHAEYQRKKRVAKGILMKRFGVSDGFVADKTQLNFLAGFLTAFEERTTAAYNDAVARGTIADLNPLAISQEIIQEQFPAFMNILRPPGVKMQKHLSRWWNLANDNHEDPSVRDLMLEIESAFANGEIHETERRQHLNLLITSVEQGMDFADIGAIINDTSIIKASDDDDEISGDVGAMVMPAWLKYIQDMMQSSIPRGTGLDPLLDNNEDEEN
jgi:hypothetical protein